MSESLFGIKKITNEEWIKAAKEPKVLTIQDLVRAAELLARKGMMEPEPVDPKLLENGIKVERKADTK